MSRVRTGEIEVHGLRELNRALKKLGPDFQRELKATNLDVASLVADDARGIAAGLGGVAAHVAPSITAKGYTTAAAVSLGGSAHPAAGGAEFGSNRYKQFKPWRGNGPDAGYFVYPSIRQNADRVRNEYEDAADALIKKAGLAR